VRADELERAARGREPQVDVDAGIRRVELGYDLR
jgi:hypothetical protein